MIITSVNLILFLCATIKQGGRERAESDRDCTNIQKHRYRD
jgi:hypothetical protein